MLEDALTVCTTKSNASPVAYDDGKIEKHSYFVNYLKVSYFCIIICLLR